MLTLKAPSTQVIVHYLAVFLLAFGTQLVAAVSGAVSISSLEAVLISAAAAGITAVAHIALGLVPTPVLPGTPLSARLNALGVSLKVKTTGYQVLTSVIATFLSIFGAELVGGAAKLTSFPDVIALVLAAIAAAVSGVVTFVVGLIPAPKPVAA